MNDSIITGEQLKSFIERIEKLEDDKFQVSDDIKAIFAEAKANGFDTKIMKQVIRIRKMDKDEFAGQKELLELYIQAIGDEH